MNYKIVDGIPNLQNEQLMCDTYYRVDEFVNSFGQSIESNIRELLSDMEDDNHLYSKIQYEKPLEETQIHTYAELKELLAKYILGLD